MREYRVEVMILRSLILVDYGDGDHWGDVERSP